MVSAIDAIKRQVTTVDDGSLARESAKDPVISLVLLKDGH